MKKRIVSFVMALVMALSLVPTSVFATDETYSAAADTSVQNVQDEQPAALAEGDTTGDAEKSAAPTITTDLAGKNAVKTGDPCTLTVEAEGTGTLSYQWYVGNTYSGSKIIKGADEATYAVATDKEQITYYYVEVTNTEEGKAPTSVYSGIVEIVVTDDGSGTFSDTPVITSDVKDAEDVVLPWNSLKSRNFSVSVKQLGMTQLSYQWYRNTERSYDGAELIPDETGESYSVLGTTVLGTNYYFCVITNTLADGTTKSTRSAIGSLTIKAPEKMEFGIVVGEEPVGIVKINVSDTVPKRDDLVNGMGEPIEDPGPYGDLVGNANLDGKALIYPSDTMMTIIARALIEDGHRQVGGEKGYISAIIANYGTDKSVELAEFRRGKGSGWMGTLNGWCTNKGFANYTVANGDVRDGDTIDIMYTTDLGKDIGCSFDATDMSLESLTLLTNDRLHPDNYVYTKAPDNFSGDTYAYEMVLDSDVTGFRVSGSLVEKQFIARFFVGDTEYRMNSDVIPFTGNMLTLTVKTEKPASDGTAETVGKTYTITLIRDQKMLTSRGDVTLQFLYKDGSTAGEEVSATPPGMTAGSGRTFSTTAPAYTADERKNVTGFILRLPKVPEGTTGEVIAPSGVSYPITDHTATVPDEIAKYGTIDFTVRLTSDGNYGIYTLSIYKQAATTGLNKCSFDGGNQSFNPENIYNGRPEGTLFRVNQGEETGETGFDTNWYEYDIHVTEKVQSLKAKKLTDIQLLGVSNVTVTANDKQVYSGKKTGTSGLGLKLTKTFIPLSGKTTDISIRIENYTNSEDVVVYTFHVIRHSIEASELETMIQALPSVEGFIYSEHAAAVQQAKKIYGEADDAVKAELPEETVEKLNALSTELERQYNEGMAQIEAVLAKVGEYKDDVPQNTTALTDELYQQYGEAIRASGKLYDTLQGWVLTQWNNGGYAEKAVLTNALKLLNLYETGSRKTIGQATDYLDDFMLTNSAFNLTLGSAWDAYPVTFRDITYSKTKVGGEAGLPWNEPGRLRFEIDDPTVFEIKEVLGSYGDRGLGSNGEVYDNVLYYLIPLKEGTTTFRVTLTDETGTFYGQTPEMIVHVNSEAEASIEKLADKLTNINSLPRTTKYDIHYFWQGQEGAPFTFKVNGDNAKVFVWDYLGDGKKTEYPVNADGTVTVLLKDGYNPIEVTADYQGQRVTQTYGLKGKVIDYTITNVTRPGQAPRIGDTIDLNITGLSVPVYKILRIYNPMGPRFVYLTDDLPQQYQLNGSNDQYHIGTMRIVLTGSGTIHLTGGYIYETWMGSSLGSELSQGNVGEIAPQSENKFSVLPDLSFEVAEYDGYTGQVLVNTEVESGNTVRAGQKITIKLPNLPTDEIAAQYPCVTTSTITKMQSVQTIFATSIPGMETIESEVVTNPLSGREPSLAPITSITITIPKDTPEGTYKVYGGYVKLRCGDPNWSISTVSLYERQIADLELTVLPAEDYSDIYNTTGNHIAALGTPDTGSIGGEWLVIDLARSGRTVPAGYYDNVLAYVKAEADANERLHNTKSTENSRVILALTAIGKDVTNVGGHNLLKGLDNMAYLQKQGINGPIWALIALDSHEYPTSGNVTREKLVQVILGAALPSGGWSYSGETADPDMTGMAIQALAPYYKTNEAVKSAVDKALGVLSDMQQDNGGFSSWGTVNSESCAQVVVALTALGIDPTVDSRFIKNGMSVLDALCGFYVTGGGFGHDNTTYDQMATEQAYYALAAYYRLVNKQTSLYDMSDVCIGHTFGDWTVTKATCTEDGSRTRTCSVCGAVETETVKALGHNLTAVAAKAATCTEPGNSAHWDCARCGKSFSDAAAKAEIAKDSWVITALGHDKATRAAVAATCYASGRTAETYCKRCGLVITPSTVIPATGKHTYENGVCSTCGVKNPLADVKGEAIKVDSKNDKTAAGGGLVIKTDGTITDEVLNDIKAAVSNGAITVTVADTLQPTNEQKAADGGKSALTEAAKNASDEVKKELTKLAEKLDALRGDSSRKNAQIEKVVDVRVELVKSVNDEVKSVAQLIELPHSVTVTIPITDELYAALQGKRVCVVRSHTDVNGNVTTAELPATLGGTKGNYVLTFQTDKASAFAIVSYETVSSGYYYGGSGTADSGKKDSAKTADDSQMVVWLGSAVLAMAGVVVLSRKKRAVK